MKKDIIIIIIIIIEEQTSTCMSCTVECQHNKHIHGWRDPDRPINGDLTLVPEPVPWSTSSSIINRIIISFPIL